MTNGTISHDKELINEEAERFYEEIFTENVHLRPTFDGLELPSLSVMQSIRLEKPIEEEEVE